jgi:predicted RNase H-like HicB family nuclease
MKLTATTALAVRFEPDENGAWIVDVVDEPRIHTHGRTLERAEANIREAIALWLSVEDGLDIDEDELELLPQFVLAEFDDVTRANQTRDQARRLEAEAQALTTEVARKLVVERKMGLRDAGYLLGLSHQRVQQLLART